MTSITTFTGKLIDLVDPQPNDICIEDIAHHLSLVNRFAGSTIYPYSVAAHSVYVSMLVPLRCAKQALMHDAQEAYIGDVTSPLKKALPDYQRIEAVFSDVIADKFGLDRIMDPEVKIADRIAYATERELLLTPTACATAKVEDDKSNKMVGVEPHPMPLPLSWIDPEQLFLLRYRELFL